MTEQIALPGGKVALVDDSDLPLVSQHKWVCNSHGYAVRSGWVGRQRQYFAMHRWLLGLPLNMDIHHINGNRMDNRRGNLHVCTRSEHIRMHGQATVREQPKKQGATSRYRGVSLYKNLGRWGARIVVRQQAIFLGLYDDETVAAHAYDVAALKYFGEYARLNFTDR